MKYFALFPVFLIASCSWMKDFNDWADSVMPRHDDFNGGSKVVYTSGNKPAAQSGYGYQQPANPGNLRPGQPNPIAPGGVLNSPNYQDPYGSGYTPPVNNLPPANHGSHGGGYQDGSTAERDYQTTDQIQRDNWDYSVPQPPF